MVSARLNKDFRDGRDYEEGLATRLAGKGLKKVTGRVGEEPGQSGERRKWYMNVLRGGCGYLSGSYTHK